MKSWYLKVHISKICHSDGGLLQEATPLFGDTRDFIYLFLLSPSRFLEYKWHVTPPCSLSRRCASFQPGVAPPTSRISRLSCFSLQHGSSFFNPLAVIFFTSLIAFLHVRFRVSPAFHSCIDFSSFFVSSALGIVSFSSVTLPSTSTSHKVSAAVNEENLNVERRGAKFNASKLLRQKGSRDSLKMHLFQLSHGSVM